MMNTSRRRSAAFVLPLALALALALAVAAACATAYPSSRTTPRTEEHQSLRGLIDSAGYRGSVVVYDLRRDAYHAVHGERSDSARVPASTFKILNALVALDAGIVAGEHAIVRWDSTVRERRELNRDLTLTEAFRISAVPHFQQIAREVGAVRMQRSLDAVGYGNRNLDGGIDQFWLTGALRISPREQVDLLVRLYREELPFSRDAQRAVKRMMEVERSPEHVIRAKTGWAQTSQDNIGWWVGWVERGGEVHVFASVIEGARPDDRFGEARTAIPRRVLERVGALPPR